MKGRMPTGPICRNCGRGWDEEQVRGEKRCLHCDYPFRRHRTPLNTGQRHELDDYVDLEDEV